MSEFTRFAGTSLVIDSGTVILGPDDPSLTIDLQGLQFSITHIDDQKAEPITTEIRSRTHVVIKINTWQGGDPTFKFKVGMFQGRDLYLAVRLDVHYSYRIITYTFSQKRP